jgi:hypothetical protein
MVKTRLQQRKETIELMTNYRNREKKENERLKRKKEVLEQSLQNYYTITGSLEEIEMETKRIKKERNEKQVNINNLIIQISKTVQRYFNFRNSIRRLQQLTYMEEDIQFYYWYGRQTNIFSTKKKTDLVITNPLLLTIKKDIPDVMMDLILEYIPYETKCDLLENKYDPIKLINKFRTRHIMEFLNKIYQSQLLESLDTETNQHIVSKFKTFYDCLHTDEIRFRMKRNITDERVFLKNIILSFKPKHSKIMYDLFKLIIVVSK